MVEIIVVYIIIVLVGYMFFRKFPRLYFLFACLLLSYLSYHVVVAPYGPMDLSQHYHALNVIHALHWGNLWEVLRESPRPLFILYLYVISFLGNNSWLPAITVFLGYFFITTIIYKYSKRLKSNQILPFFCFIFVLLNFNYNWLLSGIRNYLAFSMLALCLYMELIERKYKLVCWVIYVSICFFHFIMLVFLWLRILLIFRNKITSVFIYVLILCSILLAPLCLDYFKLFNLPLFDIAVKKQIAYQNYNTFGKVQWVICLAKLFAIVSVYFYCVFYRKAYKEKDYDAYVLMVICLVVGLTNQYQFFLRTTDFLVCLIAPYIIQVFTPPCGRAKRRNLTLHKFNFLLLFTGETLLCFGYYIYIEYRYSLFFSSFF